MSGAHPDGLTRQLEAARAALNGALASVIGPAMVTERALRMILYGHNPIVDPDERALAEGARKKLQDAMADVSRQTLELAQATVHLMACQPGGVGGHACGLPGGGSEGDRGGCAEGGAGREGGRGGEGAAAGAAELNHTLTVF